MYIQLEHLLKLQLPQLPKSMAGLKLAAKKWQFRVHNRVKEYLVPAQFAELIPPQPIASTLSVRRDRTSKLGICKKYQDYCKNKTLTYGSFPSVAQFCYEWAKGHIVSEIAQIIPRFSISSLLRWLQKAATPELLDGNYQGRLPIIDRNPEFQQLIVGLIHHRPSAIYREFKLRYKGLTIPSEATIRRWIEKWAAANPLAYSLRIKGKDATRSKFLPAFGNHSESITMPCERVEIDCTKFELMLNVGGKKMRYQVMGAIDVYSRRKIFKLVPSANKHTVVRGLMRSIYSEWGMVEQIRTDNGTEFKNGYFRDTLGKIGTDIHYCNPGNPQEKPHIERAFGSLKTMLAEMLPGFLGKDAVERKYQADRLEEMTRLDLLLTPEQVQAHLDAYCRHEDERVRKDGLAPIHKYQEQARSIKQILPEHLDRLLNEPMGERKVGKEGVSVNGLHYVCDELGEYTGQKVKVNASDDAGYVYIYSVDDKFLCRAEYPELTGKSRMEIAINARAVYRAKTKVVNAQTDLAEANTKQTTYLEAETKVVEMVLVKQPLSNLATQQTDKEIYYELEVEKAKYPEVVSPEVQKGRIKLVADIEKAAEPKAIRDINYFMKLCQKLLLKIQIPKEDADWVIEMVVKKKIERYVNHVNVILDGVLPEILYLSAGLELTAI